MRQVLAKRKKVVEQMCMHMSDSLDRELLGPKWVRPAWSDGHRQRHNDFSKVALVDLSYCTRAARR